MFSRTSADATRSFPESGGRESGKKPNPAPAKARASSWPGSHRRGKQEAPPATAGLISQLFVQPRMCGPTERRLPVWLPARRTS
jgi:hypothetical protein